MKEQFKFSCTTFAFIVAWTSLAALSSLLLPRAFECASYLALGFLAVIVPFVIRYLIEDEPPGAQTTKNFHLGFRILGGVFGPVFTAALWHAPYGGWGTIVSTAAMCGALAWLPASLHFFTGPGWCRRRLARLRGPAWAASVEAKTLRQRLRELDQEEAKDAAEIERRRHARHVERSHISRRLCELERSAGYRDEAPTSDELDRRALLGRPA